MRTVLIVIACAFCGFVIANRRNNQSHAFQHVTANSIHTPRKADKEASTTKSGKRSKRRTTKKSQENQVVWSVYTMGDFDNANLEAACQTIHRVFNYGTRVKGQHRLPSSCVKENNELNGDRCLNELQKDGERSIFITNQMIYSEELSVRGLTKLYGDVILLKNNPHFEKVLIHEMGHVLGLRHCENLACVMAIHNDAEGTEKFCERCIRLVPEGALRNRSASTLAASEVQASSNDVELDDLN